jgi:hypothetical protein
VICQHGNDEWPPASSNAQAHRVFDKALAVFPAWATNAALSGLVRPTATSVISVVEITQENTKTKARVLVECVLYVVFI